MFVLDTNIVSELSRKNRMNPRVAAWFERTGYSRMSMSVFVFAELRKGIELLSPRDPERAASLEAFHADMLREFQGGILPFTLEAAEIYGRAAARATPPMIDGLIASQAVAAGLVLVTRNTRDMARFGARLLDPFEPRPGA